MTLNDKPLVLGAGNALPEMKPVTQEAGCVELAPGTCTFLLCNFGKRACWHVMSEKF